MAGTFSRQKGLFMPVLVSLWFAVLLLPFKGISASLVLFCALLIILALLKTMRRPVSAVWQNIHPVLDRLYSHRIFSGKNALFLIIPLLVMPFFSQDYIIDVAVSVGIYCILALGLNVVVGFTGLLNLGFVAFYAIGAYSYALINTRLGLGFWSAIPFSLCITTLSGFLLAIPALRLRGDYLAIVTLGFGEIVRLVLNNWDSFTRGPNGIAYIDPPYLMGRDLGTLFIYYYLVLACVLITVLVMHRVRDSRTGRAWIAIREDETASSAMGIPVTRFKLYSFAFGAFWAGLAGSLFAAKMRFVSPESFTFMESVLIICMVILGGLGSIAGVIVGAIILIFLPEVLREVQLYRMLALGCGLVLMMIFRPQGLFGGRGASSRG